MKYLGFVLTTILSLSAFADKEVLPCEGGAITAVQIALTNEGLKSDAFQIEARIESVSIQEGFVFLVDAKEERARGSVGFTRIKSFRVKVNPSNCVAYESKQVNAVE